MSRYQAIRAALACSSVERSSLSAVSRFLARRALWILVRLRTLVQSLCVTVPDRNNMIPSCPICSLSSSPQTGSDKYYIDKMSQNNEIYFEGSIYIVRTIAHCCSVVAPDVRELAMANP